jgi:hypothetical protein
MCPFCFATMELIVAGAVYPWAGSVGREGISQEPSTRSPAELRGKEESIMSANRRLHSHPRARSRSMEHVGGATLGQTCHSQELGEDLHS